MPDRDPVALVLAAGWSRRFGADKRLVRLGSGRAIVDQVLENIRQAGLEARIVLREDDKLRTEHPWPVPIIAIKDAERGMGASLAAAARQLDDHQSCLVCLADMPFIQPATFAAIAAAMIDCAIAVPIYAGRRGHPVAFAADYLPALRALDGDRGARDLLGAAAERVVEVPVDDAGIHRDIDTVADLLRHA